ncbi:hypothetical protein QZH41_001774 [Actinostola sp. cb2023]|nr:hypothetical protein QZH41_001774 [Actinostola sp. cb2023]
MHELQADTQLESMVQQIPDDDPEVRPQVQVLATEVGSKQADLGTGRFTRFSGYYKEEMQCLSTGKKLPRNSTLLKLNPTISADGLLVVGGRLDKATDLTDEECHPIILPSSHHATILLVKHLHTKVQHQGRHFTLGIISGFWIVGVGRLVSSIIDKCVKCKKLRGQVQQQLMADLPAERLTPSPPFTYVGLDVFGPWEVVARRTRGGLAHSKRWAVIFTCLTTRAIHIEVIESMDTSCFINAMRRFLALRGPAIQLRSDRRSNFVGAFNKLQKGQAVKAVHDYLATENCEWVFNPPHASHAGGVWERMIGVVRRILDSMLTTVAAKYLTPEVLTTLMAEISAIVNGRPLVPVSCDPTAPEVLTPSTILTLKPRMMKAAPSDFDSKDLHSKLWRQVQQLANQFWARWRREYIHTLQERQKWHYESPNLQVGALVLLRDKEVARNCWPMARITQVFKAADDKVRMVELMTATEGIQRVYTRPITEVVLLKTRRDLELGEFCSRLKIWRPQIKSLVMCLIRFEPITEQFLLML